MLLRYFSALILVLGLMVVPTAAGAHGGGTNALGGENDYVRPDPDFLRGLSPQKSDPLGLVPGMEIIQMHSLGTDVIDVWACGLDVSVQTVVSELKSHVGSYFAAHSRGRLTMDFRAKGAGPDLAQGQWPTESECYKRAVANASPDANGVLLASASFYGGIGGPGHGQHFPSNDRWVVVGRQMSFWTVAAHELGHSQHWPHSFTKKSYDEYDNALDLMSGNYGVAEFNGYTEYGTYDYPYDTAVVNRYAAGWIDPNQVVVLGPASAELTLEPSSGNGLQMAVIKAGGSYFTLGARTSSAYDPIPAHWQGVEVYQITPCPEPDSSLYNCWSYEHGGRFDMGFREHVPLGQVPFDYFDFGLYDQPLAHVIAPGTSKSVGGRTVSVSSAANGGYRVSVGDGPAGATFTDTSGNVFESDIEWLSTSGITKGCNPPVNDRFCPDDPVTRGQMAAFLHRALPDLATDAVTGFTDDDGLVFEADIEWLASAGVTRGCNPPVNDSFCPHDIVTRGQMAAFLHRALPDLPITGVLVDFVDDNSNVFEADIEWLAATGVTRGCNPPVNDRFCPDAPVTRGAMAAFLQRALSG